MAGTSVDNRVVSRSSGSVESMFVYTVSGSALATGRSMNAAMMMAVSTTVLNNLRLMPRRMALGRSRTTLTFRLCCWSASVLALRRRSRFLCELPEAIEANHTCFGLALAMAFVSSVQGASLSRITVWAAGKLRAFAVALLSQTKSVLLN